MPTNDLLDFMQAVARDMESEYQRIQKRVKEDPGTAGDQGEENWATLLREWLPPAYQVVTKGRILGHTGIASPQVDVLVLQPTYPKKLLDKKLYLAGGVAAAFECKLTLRPEHIKTVFENAVQIRNLLLPRQGSIYKEFHSPLIYGLLAHSHNWKGPNATPLENIDQRIHQEDIENVTHPQQMPDFVCVSDVATWVSMRAVHPGPQTWYMISGMRPSASNQAYELQYTAVGAMLTYLLLKLAWENPALRELAYYFYRTKVAGPGFGIAREWSMSVFTHETQGKIEAITPEVLRRNETEAWFDWWDEWRFAYP